MYRIARIFITIVFVITFEATFYTLFAPVGQYPGLGFAFLSVFMLIPFTAFSIMLSIALVREPRRRQEYQQY